MSHGIDGTDVPGLPVVVEVRHGGALGALENAMKGVNKVMLFIGMVTLVVASLVLTYSVFSRYLFKAATDWQDEVAVFSIVGCVFLCGAWVQSLRGHVGIEAIASVLPAGVNRVRIAIVDILTMLFCAFFAWKSWTLFHEAWVDKMTTSSTFSPPLTIPYGLMATGMSLLVVQLVLQSIVHFVPRDENA
ncbi:MAG TPA: TRAP transporter small permease [Casimicrobiaceae bacterium]|nr:TRAP transporter small permease [Casimicrobiaceae bacterium]